MTTAANTPHFAMLTAQVKDLNSFVNAPAENVQTPRPVGRYYLDWAYGGVALLLCQNSLGGSLRSEERR